LAVALIMAGLLLPCSGGASPQVPRMSKDVLKGMLRNPDVIIIDVRLPGQWNGSKFKIMGAYHEDPGKSAESWAAKYPKDKTIVLYCS
jgi:rhodanese-related sulfurtransferase